MDSNDQLQAIQQRMKAAASARKNRPLAGMVSATIEEGNRPPSALSGARPSSYMVSSSTSSSSSNFSNSSISPSAVSSFSKPNTAGSTSSGLSVLSSSSTNRQDDRRQLDRETAGQEQIRKQLERVGIAPAVDTAVDQIPKHIEPRTAESAKLDLADPRTFLGQPPPKVGMIQCFILRDKAGSKYKLFLEDKNNSKFLLASVKRKNNKTSNYLISLHPDDLNRDSSHYYGKLRANFVGTEFTIFDRGDKPNPTAAGAQPLTVRQELGAVLYERNILGTKGPRKMFAIIPSVDDGGRRSIWRPEKEDDGLIPNFRKGVTKDMIIMKNKDPSWNEQLRAYVLNFGGRVTMASVKNFQLVDQDNPSKVLMQFGKMDANKFSLDFQYPVCGMQAFSIALSAFDSKLACE